MADSQIVNSALARWQALQPRERLVLSIGAAVLGLVLAYLLIASPLSDRRTQLEAQVKARSATLAVVRQAAAEVQAMPDAPVSAADDSVSLLTRVDQTARQAGLAAAIRRIEPVEPGVVRMQLEGAEFDVLIGWLEQMQVQSGIRVSEARLAAAEAAGRVDGRLQLGG